MDHSEQMVYCKKCENQTFDEEQGLLCGLTNEKPTFVGTCPNFKELKPTEDNFRELHPDFGAELKNAEISLRLVNVLIDLFIVGMMYYIPTFLITGAMIAMAYSSGNTDSFMFQIFSILINLLFFVVFFCYYSLMEFYKGKTVGKMVSKTKVIKIDNTDFTMGQAFLRTLCRLIPFEFISIFLNEDRVMWHDNFTNTRVVVEKPDYMKFNNKNS